MIVWLRNGCSVSTLHHGRPGCPQWNSSNGQEVRVNLFNGLGDSLESLADQGRVQLPNLAERHLAYSGQFREMSHRFFSQRYYNVVRAKCTGSEKLLTACMWPKQLELVRPRRSSNLLHQYS